MRELRDLVGPDRWTEAQREIAGHVRSYIQPIFTHKARELAFPVAVVYADFLRRLERLGFQPNSSEANDIVTGSLGRIEWVGLREKPPKPPPIDYAGAVLSDTFSSYRKWVESNLLRYVAHVLDPYQGLENVHLSGWVIQYVMRRVKPVTHIAARSFADELIAAYRKAQELLRGPGPRDKEASIYAFIFGGFERIDPQALVSDDDGRAHFDTSLEGLRALITRAAATEIAIDVEKVRSEVADGMSFGGMSVVDGPEDAISGSAVDLSTMDQGIKVTYMTVEGSFIPGWDFPIFGTLPVGPVVPIR
jgi:hypothetical protein